MQVKEPPDGAGALQGASRRREYPPHSEHASLRALIDGRLGTAPDRSSLVLLAAQLIPEEALEAEVHDEVGRGASGKWPSTGGGRRGTGPLEPARSGHRCPARRSSSPGGEVALTSSSGFRPCTTSQPRAGQASP